MHQNFKKDSTDKEIICSYHKYITNFICEKLLLILGKLAIIGIFVFIVYLLFIFVKADKKAMLNSMIIPSIVYSVILIIRIIKHYPKNAFLAFNFNEKFQEIATNPSCAASYNSGSNGWFGNNDDDMDGYMFIFNILKSPADAVGDIICLTIQITKVLLINKRYKNFIVILIQMNGDSITGGEIFSKLTANKSVMNEIKCCDRINEMLSFEWILIGRDGYKMSMKMRRNLDKNYQDDPIF